MIHKHVNFYMTESDERDFISLAYSKFNVSFIQEGSKDEPVYSEIEDAESCIKQMVKNPSDKFPEWIIRLKGFGDDILRFHQYKLGPPPFKIKFEINHPDNAVIYFDRCFMVNDYLKEGELNYAETRDWIDFKRYTKPKEWSKPYNSLSRWIRKIGVKATWDGVKPVWNTYILPGAVEFFKAGGQLGCWRDETDIVMQSIRPIGSILVRTEYKDKYYSFLIYLRRNYCNYNYYLLQALKSAFKDKSFNDIQIIKYIALTIEGNKLDMLLSEGKELLSDDNIPLKKLYAATGKDFKDKEEARLWLKQFLSELSRANRIEGDRILTKCKPIFESDTFKYSVICKDSYQEKFEDVRLLDVKLNKEVVIKEDPIIRLIILMKFYSHHPCIYHPKDSVDEFYTFD
jgi:hypothetical protein